MVELKWINARGRSTRELARPQRLGWKIKHSGEKYLARGVADLDNGDARSDEQLVTIACRQYIAAAGGRLSAWLPLCYIYPERWLAKYRGAASTSSVTAEHRCVFLRRFRVRGMGTAIARLLVMARLSQRSASNCRPPRSVVRRGGCRQRCGRLFGSVLPQHPKVFPGQRIRTTMRSNSTDAEHQ